MKLTDFTYLREFSNNDQAFIREMTNIFLEEAPVYLQQLRDSYEANDWDALSKTAHSLKSSVKLMGIASIHADVYELEQAAKSPEQPERLLMLIENIASVCNAASVELRQKLETI